MGITKLLECGCDKIYGNTKIGLPYVVALWHDCMSQPHISLQLQMLSGYESYERGLHLGLLTDELEFVVTLPMSPYQAWSDFAFNTFILTEQKVSEKENDYLLILLKHHPKCTVHMVAVSKIKGCKKMDGFFYKQHIHLPCKVMHSVATANDDMLFFWKKFVEYPDGSVFLHVGLVAESQRTTTLANEPR